MKVTDFKDFQFQRGRRLFRNEAPAPKKPPDEDFNPPTNTACLWLGWMTERAVDWDRRRKVARQLNMPDPDIAEYREG
jgi:hypothetical protein